MIFVKSMINKFDIGRMVHMRSEDLGRVYVAAWLGTAASVSVGILITNSAVCLWAMLIPMFGTIAKSDKN